MPRCRRRRCGASRPAPDRNPTPPPRPCMENDETVPNQLYDSNQPTAPYDLVPTYCYHLSGSDDIHSIDGLKDFQIGSHLSRVILKDFRIGSIGVFNFFQHAMSRRARDAKTYADSPNFPSYERVYGLNKTFDMEERKTFISSVCNHLWLEKLYGITRVAVYGVDSICVVMRNKDLVQLEKDLARLKGSTCAMFETLPNALINEVEDLACPPRESRTINCKRSQKPFGVVSVIAGTNKVPKISGHEDSGDKIELKAIKFLREEMNSASTFTFHKTVKTALCAFHHLWNKKFKPNKIRVFVWKSEWERDDYDCDYDTVQELKDKDILAVCNKQQYIAGSGSKGSLPGVYLQSEHGSGMKIGSAELKDGLYYFKKQPTCSVYKTIDTTDDILLWVQILGHPNFSYLKMLFPSLFCNKDPSSFKCEV